MAPRKKPNKQVKNDPKMAKLDAFLQDFDIDVETRVKQMKENINQLLTDASHSYNCALFKLPKHMRKMPWMEYCKSNKLPEEENVKREEEATVVSVVTTEDQAVQLNSVKKTPKKNGAAKTSSDDENVPRTAKKGRAAKKPPTTSKKAKALSVCKRHSSIRRSARKQLTTPAGSRLDSSWLMGATPLVTPRFDSRLPKTPAARGPRHKERVYSISVNGSPIAGRNEDIVIQIPSGNGESVQLLASQMESVDLSLLDETALKSIRLLQNRLINLCGTSG